MKAIETKNTNCVFKAEGCLDLPATIYNANETDYTETCFELSEKDIEMINKTGKIYYTVVGKTIIPFLLHTESLIEEKTE